eukprot:TRINITY_DN105668_c0_g1_i1.p1 TRINITY_DN105668_c0_g1~~TRINITY_DN105668_c0_g1_i1.p1  ORF type:complete len:1206 (-),score=193.07 TRINITY_DN105668_c0_g1_i1:8-3625(-)
MMRRALLLLGCCLGVWIIAGLPVHLTDAQRELDRTGFWYLWGLLRMAGKSYSDVFCSRSTDNCDTVDNFPGSNVHSVLDFGKVVEELQKTPEREERGEIRRLGDLGYFIFNDLLWTKDWKTFPIGANFEDHRKHRPTADKLMGHDSSAWNRTMIRKSAETFLESRQTLTKADLSTWTNKLFHKILLDIDLTDDEAAEFEDYKGSSMMAALLPRWLCIALSWVGVVNLEELRDQRDTWLQMYITAMGKDKRGIIVVEGLEARDLRFLADLLLTAMTSAGGISVPTVIHLCLGVIYGGDNSPLRASERYLKEANIEPLVLETIRRYPPVVGFPWWSPDLSKRTVLNVAMALRDIDAWGEDALEFKLRPLSYYHKTVGSGSKIGVAWAEQAKGPKGLTADSRGCPGQTLSLAIATEFLRAFREEQDDWVVTSMPEGGIKLTEGPSAASDFTLTHRPKSEGVCATVMDGQCSQANQQRGAEFHCPRECLYCCTEGRFFSESSGRQFNCHLTRASASMSPESNHSCSELIEDVDTEGLFKRCSFTESEIDAGLPDKLPHCFDQGGVHSYQEFLGQGRLSHRKKDFCSITYTGTFFGVGVVGEIIKYKMFKAGSICASKADEFVRDGMANDGFREELCKMLKDDLSKGYLDTYSLAVWNAAIGKLPRVTNFPKPESHRQLLETFRIPGWTARTVAYTTPPGDRQIDLMNGAFMCMMRKLQELPLEDDLGNDRNVFVGESSRDLNERYFNRYGLYQTPLHFQVPLDELHTDRTLERLVFEAIGSHRVELFQDGRAVSLNPIGVQAAATAQLAGGAGPLSALPSDVSARVSFGVRLEGLFDDVPLRKGMARWGGNAFFNSAGKIEALQCKGETLLVRDASKRWEECKFTFRSSLISTVTAFDHLVSAHILVAENLAMATLESLPPRHGLRILLTPHTWGSLKINLGAANNLFAKNMLVHRASPFDDAAFGDDDNDGILWKKIKSLKYDKFSDVYKRYIDLRQESPQTTEIPFFDDGKLLFDALSRYVSKFVHKLYQADSGSEEACDAGLSKDNGAKRFVDSFFKLSDPGTPEFWPDDFRDAHKSCTNLIALLSECVFLVSGWHRHVGSVADFFRDTSFASTAWKEGEHEARPKHSMMMMLLAATTNAILPKLSQNLSDIYDDSSDVVDIFSSLKKDMEDVQSQIEQRNARRKAAGRLEFHQMEPQYVEWGVEV